MTGFRTERTIVMLALVASLVLASAGQSIAAPVPGVALKISLVAQPTNLALSHHDSGEPADQYTLVLTNTGTLPSSGPITLTDKLPAGITVGGEFDHTGWECPAKSGSSLVVCTYAGVIPALGRSEVLTIPVAVTVAPGTTVINSVTVSGGDAPVAAISRSTEAGGPVPPFGFSDFSLQASDISGAPDTQAGDHPYALTTTIAFPEQELSRAPMHPEKPVQIPRALELELPAGLVGDPQAVPRCTIVAFVSLTCPASSRVGTAFINLAQAIFENESSYPIYNITPEHGYPAEFGVYAEAIEKYTFIYASVGPGPDYRLHISVPDIPNAASLTNMTVTFFGNPETMNNPPGQPINAPSAFFTNPSDCVGAPLKTTIKVNTYEEPNHWVEGETQSAPVAGCDLLQFQPTIAFTPESTRADEPSGYTVDLQIPQSQSTGLEGLATADLKDVKVTLPRGVSVNPAAADGLGACPATGPEGFNMEGAESQAPDSVGAMSPVPGHCPLNSQVGTVEAETPLLPPHALTGHVYVAQPECGGEGQEPCTEMDAQNGRLFSLYLQLEGEGVVIKLHGIVSTNPSDGQLTAIFDNNPQVPVSDIKLHLTGGPRASLANPATCGEAVTTSDLTPWSSPETPDAHPASAFTVTGCEGSPFSPAFSAGTTSTNAASYTDFTATFHRPDRQQNLDAVQVTTPPGLLGMLSHIVLCGKPQAAQGTCSSASQIGTATAGAGAGSHPYWVSGPVFLTGPYRGAPFGLSIAIPAKAGPFNLGTVVVRSAITINPETSAITITSDPLPQILDGVPLRIQTVNVTVDRPQFMFNPTSCNAQQITGILASAQGATAQVSSPFAASGCRYLPFKPSFSASTRGQASKADGASLRVKVTSAAGQANIRKVDLQLPITLPARLTTLQKACREEVFNTNPSTCDPSSVIGYATIHTPVLDQPLSGPAYLVSHGGAAFPDVEFVLQGEGVTLVLDGKTDIKHGITYSRFESAPDAPFTTFETVLPAGPHSVLTAFLPERKKFNLCGENLQMPTTMTGQNGASFTQNTRIEVQGCSSSISVVSSNVKNRTLTLSVYVPAAGRLTASGKGFFSTSKSSSGRETLTLTINQKRLGKLQTTLDLSFAPSKGKKQTKTFRASFR